MTTYDFNDCVAAVRRFDSKLPANAELHFLGKYEANKPHRLLFLSSVEPIMYSVEFGSGDNLKVQSRGVMSWDQDRYSRFDLPGAHDGSWEAMRERGWWAQKVRHITAKDFAYYPRFDEQLGWVANVVPISWFRRHRRMFEGRLRREVEIVTNAGFNEIQPGVFAFVDCTSKGDVIQRMAHMDFVQDDDFTAHMRERHG